MLLLVNTERDEENKLKVVDFWLARWYDLKVAFEATWNNDCHTFTLKEMVDSELLFWYSSKCQQDTTNCSLKTKQNETLSKS